MKALTTAARKTIVFAIAAVCLVVGLLTVLTPLPTGIPLIAIGVVLIVSVSKTARRLLRRARARWHRLDHTVAFVEERAARNWSTMLKRTRPLARKMEAKSALKAASAALKSPRVRPKRKGGS